MKIAICDDNSAELTRVSSLLEIYQTEKKVGFTYRTFLSAPKMLEEMHQEIFDLLFLDILMPEVNGMQAAHSIRTFDEDIKIVFLTSSPEFAVESYTVEAYTYLLKPITRETLFPLLDKLFAQKQRTDDYFIVKCKTGVIRILFSKLSYVEVLGKTLFFHMIDGAVYEASASLSEYETVILSHPYFLRVHRSFLVNLLQIKELTRQDFITLDGDTVPISRRLYSTVKDAYVKSLFTKKEGILT